MKPGGFCSAAQIGSSSHSYAFASTITPSRLARRVLQSYPRSFTRSRAVGFAIALPDYPRNSAMSRAKTIRMYLIVRKWCRWSVPVFPRICIMHACRETFPEPHFRYAFHISRLAIRRLLGLRLSFRVNQQRSCVYPTDIIVFSSTPGGVTEARTKCRVGQA